MARPAGEARLTGQEEQDEPVHNQHRPEHRNIKDLEPAADEADEDDTGGRVPELELWQPSNEGPELLVLLCRQGPSRAVLHLVIDGLIGRVELGLQEGEEEIEQVDTEGVGN